MSATRQKANELKSRSPTAPEFELGWLSKDQLDVIVRAYEAIASDPVRTPKKRGLIAACYRIHGSDFLPFAADYVRIEGTAQNLLSYLRMAEPRVRGEAEVEKDSLVELILPEQDLDEAGNDFRHTGLPCPPKVCLANVIYCKLHSPSYDPQSSRRYDRRPSPAIAGGVLPNRVIDIARAELRRRLQTPDVAMVGRQHDRLVRRLEQLKKQHGWGDLADDDYQRQRDEVRTSLAALPGDNRVSQFDAYRARVLEPPEAIAAASPARREELCRIILERVVVRDREIEAIEWVPAMRPFFKRQRECPQGDSNP